MPYISGQGEYNIVSLSYTLAAPVLLGMMLKLAALPPLQSLADGPSTVFWVADIEVSCYHFTANYKYLPNNASTKYCSTAKQNSPVMA
jgi:hypothetical protein